MASVNPSPFIPSNGFAGFTSQRSKELISLTEKNYGDKKEDGTIGKTDLQEALKKVDGQDKKDLQALLDNFDRVDTLSNGQAHSTLPGVIDQEDIMQYTKRNPEGQALLESKEPPSPDLLNPIPGFPGGSHSGARP